MVQHLVHRGDADDLEPLFHVLGDLGQVFLVLLRDQDLPDAAPKRREKLLLQSTDGEHAARVLIAASPTRGLDVGAIETVWGILDRARDRGEATGSMPAASSGET